VFVTVPPPSFVRTFDSNSHMPIVNESFSLVFVLFTTDDELRDNEDDEDVGIENDYIKQKQNLYIYIFQA
jgi:hypothetical protein